MSGLILHIVIVMLLALTLTESERRFVDYENGMFRENFAKYNCYQLRVCTPGSPAVCGFDASTSQLSVFEDRCTLYKTNCNLYKYFKEVPFMRCMENKRKSGIFKLEEDVTNIDESDTTTTSTTTKKPWTKGIPVYRLTDMERCDTQEEVQKQNLSDPDMFGFVHVKRVLLAKDRSTTTTTQATTRGKKTLGLVQLVEKAMHY